MFEVGFVYVQRIRGKSAIKLLEKFINYDIFLKGSDQFKVGINYSN